MKEWLGPAGFAVALLTTSILNAATANVTEKPAPAEIPTRFESVLSAPEDIAVSLTRGSRGEILDLANVLIKINKTAPVKIRMTVFVPESFEPLGPKVMSPVPRELESLKKDLVKLDKTFADAVRYEPYSYLQFPWLHDLGEATWQKLAGADKWSRAFLDLNPGNRASAETKNPSKWPVDSKAIFKSNLPLEEPQFIRAALKRSFSWNLSQLPVVKQDLEFETLGNRGSNLIVLPDGAVAVGGSAPAEMKSLVEKQTRKPVLGLSIPFLQQQDVTQVYALVPAKNTCGYALLKADPLWGLELKKKEGRDNESLEEALFYFAAKELTAAPNTAPVVSLFSAARPPRRYAEVEAAENYAGEIKYYDFVVQKTLVAQQQIDSGAELLVKYFKDQKLCAKLETVALPVLPVFPDAADYFDALGEALEHENFGFATPSPALVVLGDQILLSDFSGSPEKYRATLKDLTLKQFAKIGLTDTQIHFIRPPSDVDGAGSLLASTLVLRTLSEPQKNR